ncbi:cyclase family protein [Aquamicrobium sp. LC103]|uniref:cyclase family protein n=1 Tax=Aquamicrobium sp. LC103 TaxID=1120658 RepID=UPI00063EA3C8|nr:cyclase family protein [Aquamicrobium sp. LC103]TKT82666.1 cyclase family protein [Aquamicrobium sp. LC103]
MCHHCVIENVKSNMLSRRNFFKGGLAAAAAATAVSAAPRPLLAQAAPRKAEDLTHELHEAFPTFFGDQQLFIEQKFSFAKDTFNLNEWRINEHTGTHIDAPLHFSADGKSVAELPVEDLFLPLVVVDISAKAAEDPDAQVTPDDVKAWTDANGDIPEGACVAMHSGWGAHVATEKFRNLGDDGKTMHFPGFHVETARMLMELPSVKAIAVDTLSLDFGKSPDFAVHNSWLPSGRYGIEGVANLDRLPASGATIVVGAPKIRGATGGPGRIFALV